MSTHAALFPALPFILGSFPILKTAYSSPLWEFISTQRKVQSKKNLPTVTTYSEILGMTLSWKSYHHLILIF